MSAYWLKNEDDQLRKLWNDGLSAAQIGQLMSRSKNGVLGRAHRLELTARGQPSAFVTPRPATSREPRPAVPTLAELLPMAAVPQAAPPNPPPSTPQKPPHIPAAGACLWPTWKDKGPSYWAALRAGGAPCCGKPTLLRVADDGAVLRCVYCPEHTRKARFTAPTAAAPAAACAS